MPTSPDRVRLQQGLTAAAILTGAALFIRLGGAARTWMSPEALLVIMAVLVLASRAVTGLQPAVGLSAWRDWFRRYRFAICLAATVVVTLVIRLPGLRGDLGHAPIDIDENRLAANVRDYFLTNQIGYETVEHYPGVVYWLLVGASLLAYLRALLHGTITAMDGMTIEAFTETGRMVSVWTAAGIVAFTGLLGRRVAGETSGLIAALVVAAARMSVDTTTILRNDPGQVLLLVITVYAALAVYRSDQWPLTFCAGVLAGLATGVKYTSVLVIVPVLMAALFGRTWPSRLSKCGIALVGLVLAVGVSNHFVWADFPNFLRQLSDQILVSRSGLSENPAALHLDHLLNFGPGWPLLILAAGYGAYGLGRGRPEAWIFWSFPILYSWFTTRSLTQFVRWVFPLLPFLAVAGAAGLTAIARSVSGWEGWQRQDSRRVSRPALAALMVAGALFKPVWDGVASFTRRMATPTHEIVENWINEYAAGDTVLVPDAHLVFDGTIETRRVPLLRQTFGGGLNSRLVADWLVVPESDRPAADLLRGFTPALHVEAGQGMGGNTGLDYDVYMAPRIPHSDKGQDVLLTDPAAADLLGHEWVGDERVPGLALPPEGAGLFLPPLAWSDVRLTFELHQAGLAEPPFTLTVAGHPVTVSIVDGRARGTQAIAEARVPDPSRVTELRLAARGGAGRVSIVRFGYARAGAD